MTAIKETPVVLMTQELLMRMKKLIKKRKRKVWIPLMIASCCTTTIKTLHSYNKLILYLCEMRCKSILEMCTCSTNFILMKVAASEDLLSSFCILLILLSFILSNLISVNL